MARSSFAMLALLAALLLVAARPARSDCSNDDEGADDDASCPQVGCCLFPCTCWPEPVVHRWTSPCMHECSACRNYGSCMLLPCALIDKLWANAPAGLRNWRGGYSARPTLRRWAACALDADHLLASSVNVWSCTLSVAWMHVAGPVPALMGAAGACTYAYVRSSAE